MKHASLHYSSAVKWWRRHQSTPNIQVIYFSTNTGNLRAPAVRGGSVNLCFAMESICCLAKIRQSAERLPLPPTDPEPSQQYHGSPLAASAVCAARLAADWRVALKFQNKPSTRSHHRQSASSARKSSLNSRLRTRRSRASRPPFLPTARALVSHRRLEFRNNSRRSDHHRVPYWISCDGAGRHGPGGGAAPGRQCVPAEHVARHTWQAGRRRRPSRWAGSAAASRWGWISPTLSSSSTPSARSWPSARAVRALLVVQHTSIAGNVTLGGAFSGTVPLCVRQC